MDLVVPSIDGGLEINFSWLPTWLGLNQPMLRVIDAGLQESFQGRAFTPELMAEMNQKVIELLVKEFPAIKGLDQLLSAVAHVRIEP